MALSVTSTTGRAHGSPWTHRLRLMYVLQRWCPSTAVTGFPPVSVVSVVRVCTKTLQCLFKWDQLQREVPGQGAFLLRRCRAGWAGLCPARCLAMSVSSGNPVQTFAQVLV